MAIEVLVVDERNRPLSDIAVQIARSSNEVLLQRTGPKGLTRFEKLVPGSYQLTLPLIDEEAWLLVQSLALKKPQSSGDACWAPPENSGLPDSYEVELGDCMASIAFRFGFLPETLWDFGGNSKLQDGVKRLHILNPKDIVKLPKQQQRTLSASTGMRYEIRRKGVLETLKIRFVNYRGEPRVGERYLLSLETASGTPVPDKKGNLDGGGFLVEPIPPDASFGEILLEDTKGNRESVSIDLGYVNPVSEVSGAQARLNNLHYAVGSEKGEMNDQTIEALCQFQFDQKLPVTGQIDGPTQARLKQLHLS